MMKDLSQRVNTVRFILVIAALGTFIVYEGLYAHTIDVEFHSRDVMQLEREVEQKRDKEAYQDARDGKEISDRQRERAERYEREHGA